MGAHEERPVAHPIHRAWPRWTKWALIIFAGSVAILASGFRLHEDGLMRMVLISIGILGGAFGLFLIAVALASWYDPPPEDEPGALTRS